MSSTVDKISCPKFGGVRLPHSCIVLDRYKSCRKNCSELKKYLEDNPNAVKESMDRHERTKSKMALPADHAGKGLPVPSDPELECSVCGFEAKSKRGLRAHQTRTHGIQRKKIRKRKRKKEKAQ